MRTTYLPSKDAQLLAWSQSFIGHLSPDPTLYGLTMEQVGDYQTVQGTYAAAYEAANNATTRTKATIVAKNNAKQALVEATRQLVNICQAWPEMTDDKRALLQITIRDNEPTPVPVPKEAPQLDVVKVQGRTLKLRLRDSVTGERKKPAGVQGATLVSYVGETIPSSLRDWTFEANTTRVDVSMEFGESVPMGAKVWVAAFWYNRRAESGPACSPVAAHVGFGALVEDVQEAA